MKNSIRNNSSFDSSNQSNNLSKETEKDFFNISNNISIEDLLNTDDIIEKMSNYKNKSFFSQ
jgi:hypothetical protein